jgi:hypothetical protein
MRAKAEVTADVQGTESDLLTGWRVCSLPQLAAAKVSKSNFLQNSGNSLDISKAFFEMGIWKFESSQVSQAVRGSENFFLK